MMSTYTRPILKPSRLTRNVIAHGGNIMADIGATKIMERREPVRANAWKVLFGRSYGVHFTMYEAISIFQPPSGAALVPPQQSRKTNLPREDSPESPGGQPSSPPVEMHETTRAGERKGSGSSNHSLMNGRRTSDGGQEGTSRAGATR